MYDGEWPKGATRVRKETRALAEAGHEVHLIARNLANAPPREEETWMTVWRLPRLPGRRTRYALNFPLFVNPIWLWRMWRVARRAGADLVLVCDLPLAPSAVWLGRMLGVPVHYDMGEIYPEFLRSLRLTERQGPLKRLIRTPRLAEGLERYVLRRVAAVYVVSPESRERCVGLGVPADRLVIVGNTPENLAELVQPRPVPVDIADLAREERAILLFVGILIADRGVADVIRALPTVQIRHPKATLVVVGDGPERKVLEETVSRLGLERSVRLVGWKAPEELPGYYQASAIGLLPFRDSPHVRLTLANKLFDYMGAGLPVLASDLPSMHRVLEETQAGRMHAPDNPADLARVASGMLDDPAGRRILGENGRRAALTDYSWEHDAARLREAVARLR